MLNNDSLEAALHSIGVAGVLLSKTEDGILVGSNPPCRSITCIGGDCVGEMLMIEDSWVRSDRDDEAGHGDPLSQSSKIEVLLLKISISLDIGGLASSSTSMETLADPVGICILFGST